MTATSPPHLPAVREPVTLTGTLLPACEELDSHQRGVVTDPVEIARIAVRVEFYSRSWWRRVGRRPDYSRISGALPPALPPALSLDRSSPTPPGGVA